MCGIVGIAGNFSRERTLELIAKMNQAIVHRGPDDEGMWAQDGFGFGMRRLSIIDINGGAQPMWEENACVGVVFNGEIYNFNHLRDRLKQRGVCDWTTRSDTEVLLKSYVTDGEQAIHDWNGMFSVAFWNAREEKLTLIRDRLGVKPLYYFWDGKTFIFASEIKAILASELVPRVVNGQAVWDYLTYRYVPGPETVWQRIRKIPPAHFLQLRLKGEPEIFRYWKSDVISNSEPAEQEQIDHEFAKLFLDAVELRLVASDVPVGVFLSGGLDSSAIAAAAVELGHRNFHTFSVGFSEGGEFSELAFAREVANYVGAQYHEVSLDQATFLEMLPEVVNASDEPIADLTTGPLLSLSRLARAHVKVVLSGEGSDEILAGYDLDQNQLRWSLVRSLQSLPAIVLESAAALFQLSFNSGLRQQVENVTQIPLKDWNRRSLPHITNYFGQAEKQLLWPNHTYENSSRIIGVQYAEAKSSDPLQQLLSVYQKGWLVEDLLMKADKMSMASSLEVRTPFLDYRLVEWANHQPNSVKLRRVGLTRFSTKDVLRRFCKRRLPASIINRPKRGFPVPAYMWIQKGMHKWTTEMLLGRASIVAQHFNHHFLKQVILMARDGIADSPHRLWILILLELWLREWNADLP